MEETFTESIVTAEGHKYTGDLTTIVGMAGLVLEGKGTMFFTNGDKYVGEWHRNKRSGSGTMFYVDGSMYEGEWYDDKRHGYGHYVSVHGSSYEGCFVLDDRKGMGVEVVTIEPASEEREAVCERYTGAFFNNKRHGRGILDRPDKTVFEGMFVNGVMEGAGTLKFPNGDVFTGTFKNNAMHGQGVFTFANGETYEGEYADGIRTGGIMQRCDGTRYKADFLPNGEVAQLFDMKTGAAINFEEQNNSATELRWKNGTGFITYPNGDKYTGAFLNNMRDGYGVMEYSNGDKYDGCWKEDKRSGEGKMVWNKIQRFGAVQGWRYIGTFEDDLFHGHGELRYDTEGNFYSGKWNHGVRDGLGKENRLGDSFEGTFVDGVRCGPGKLTTRENVVYEGLFEKGEMNDENATVVYSPGVLFKGSIVGLQRHGEGHMIYENGDVYDGEFAEDEKQGVGIMHFANGDEYQGQWKHDMMDGNGIFQFADGSKYDGKMHHNLKHGSGKFVDVDSNSFSVTYRSNTLLEKKPLVL